jgi:hypothetical protein
MYRRFLSKHKYRAWYDLIGQPKPYNVVNACKLKAEYESMFQGSCTSHLIYFIAHLYFHWNTSRALLLYLLLAPSFTLLPIGYEDE